MDAAFYMPDIAFKYEEQFNNELDILKFKKNQILYSEGSTPLGIFYLEEGEVLISKLASQGKEQVLRVISKKGILCCADLILNKRYSSSSRATKDSVLVFIPKASFHKVISQNKEFNSDIMSQLSTEILSLENQVVSLAYKPLRGRLADKLLSLDNICDGNQVNSISLSRTDLAGYTGTVKEMINRLLCEFQKEEMISLTERQIRILDRPRLHRISLMYD